MARACALTDDRLVLRLQGYLVARPRSSRTGTRPRGAARVWTALARASYPRQLVTTTAYLRSDTRMRLSILIAAFVTAFAAPLAAQSGAKDSAAVVAVVDAFHSAM